MLSKTAKTFIFAAIVAGSIGTAGGARAAFGAGDRIDRTTVADARRAIEAAGYRQVRDLKKGCDNFWHGTATKDGSPVYVVVSPKGEVMTEGAR
jgi:zona occludens toxin (predicted ATPase)